MDNNLSVFEYYSSHVESTYIDLQRSFDEKKSIFSSLLNDLKIQHSKLSKASNAEKGKSLERIVSFLLETFGIFEIKENLRTSTNEIDHVIMLNGLGKFLQSCGQFKFSGDYFVSECKNYNKKISATWVGKFFCLLQSHECKFGIIFSYNPLSGKSWSAASGLTKKIYLLREDDAKKTVIINFSFIDFEKLESGYSFFKLIDDKIDCIKLDVSIESLISSKHPAQN